MAIADIGAIADMMMVSPYEAEDFLRLIIELDNLYLTTRFAQIAKVKEREARKQKRRNKGRT